MNKSYENHKTQDASARTRDEPRGGFMQIVNKVYAAESQAFMRADLTASGLTPDDISAIADVSRPVNVDKAAVGSYVIPYYDLEGNALPHAQDMFRRRLNYSVKGAVQIKDKERYPKYKSPPNTLVPEEHRGIPYIPPTFWQLEVAEQGVVDILEGEKKCAAFTRAGKLPALGIPGCWNWGYRDEEGQRHVHPWILMALRRGGAKKVRIWPDGDFRKLVINIAYGTFARLLEHEGFEVIVMDMSRLNPGKVDDYIVKHGFAVLLKEAKEVSLSTFAFLKADLISGHSLMVSENRDGVQTIIDNEANIMRLLEEHPMFAGTVWWNKDRARACISDRDLDYDLDPIAISAILQRQFHITRTPPTRVARCLLATAQQHQKSPLSDWLRGLRWDKTRRLETWLHRIMGAEDTPHSRECSAKTLVGAVARVCKPGCMVDFMLCLIGPQGIGKSGMIPVLFGEGNTAELQGWVKPETAAQIRASHWVIEDAELDSLKRADSNTKKQEITVRVDTYRPPYGRVPLEIKRHCIYIGTGNKGKFLTPDETGQRRYAVVEVSQVDWEALYEEREQLFAEAMHVYASVDAHWFSNVSTASGSAKQYEKESEILPYVEEALKTFFIAPERVKKYKEKEYHWIKTGELKMAVTDMRPGKPIYDGELRDALRQLEFVCHDKMRINGKALESVWMREVPH